MISSKKSITLNRIIPLLVALSQLCIIYTSNRVYVVITLSWAYTRIIGNKYY